LYVAIVSHDSTSQLESTKEGQEKKTKQNKMGPSSTFLSQTSVYWKVYQNITNKTYSKSTFPSLTLTTQVYSPVPFVRNLTTSVVSSKNFSRISFPQFSPLVADEVHKITQVLHFQACFLAPIEEK